MVTGGRLPESQRNSNWWFSDWRVIKTVTGGLLTRAGQQNGDRWVADQRVIEMATGGSLTGESL